MDKIIPYIAGYMPPDCSHSSLIQSLSFCPMDNLVSSPAPPVFS